MEQKKYKIKAALRTAPGLCRFIGSTPLLRLSSLEKALGLKARVYAKAESFNPGGSVKDRAAFYMVAGAVKAGAVKKGGYIIEPTSGNTGIGLAVAAAAYGLRLILVMPENMSEERKKLLKGYGAELILTSAALGMKGATERSDALLLEMCAKSVAAISPGQFTSALNPLAHYETTAPEIHKSLKSPPDIFVAGVGTGGTFTGCARYFKEINPFVKAYAVEPEDSPLLSGGKPGPHKIQGIGANFLPPLFNPALADGILGASFAAARETALLLSGKEGFLAGVSGAAALSEAIKLARLPENAGKSIAVILPDGGERYLSTGFYG